MDLKTQAKIMERERQKPSNKYCADCGTISPQWISTNFGVFICLRCSGMFSDTLAMLQLKFKY